MEVVRVLILAFVMCACGGTFGLKQTFLSDDGKDTARACFEDFQLEENNVSWMLPNGKVFQAGSVIVGCEDSVIVKNTQHTEDEINTAFCGARHAPSQNPRSFIQFTCSCKKFEIRILKIVSPCFPNEITFNLLESSLLIQYYEFHTQWEFNTAVFLKHPTFNVYSSDENLRNSELSALISIWLGDLLFFKLKEKDNSFTPLNDEEQEERRLHDEEVEHQRVNGPLARFLNPMLQYAPIGILYAP